MQTPNNARGRETERIMYQWRKDNPKADSSTYNREYERVYGSLDEGQCEYIEHKEAQRSYTKFRPTKGAFGKSKLR